jgi:hypothetical protein
LPVKRENEAYILMEWKLELLQDRDRKGCEPISDINQHLWILILHILGVVDLIANSRIDQLIIEIACQTPLVNRFINDNNILIQILDHRQNLPLSQHLPALNGNPDKVKLLINPLLLIGNTHGHVDVLLHN